MNPLINRIFEMPADGWFQICPLGEFTHSSGITQVIDAPAVQAMVQDFSTRSQKPNFPGLLVDFDHFSGDIDKPSEAAGWITDLQFRNSDPDPGLWSKIRWSDVGEAAVKGGRYRLVSPVFSAQDAETLPNRRIRVKRLLSVALTNDPNIKGIVPLSNRIHEDVAHRKAGPNPNLIQTPTMKSLLLALGLSAEASEESALTKVTELKNRLAEIETAMAPIKNRAEQAENDLKTLRTGIADTDLAPFKNRLPAGTEEFWKQNLLSNREAALNSLAVLFPAPAAAATGKILNRSDATPPESNPRQDGETLKSSVRTIMNRDKVDFETAFNTLRREQPDKFTN